jgi:Ca2+-dependent lipid-binding protein
MDAGLGTCDAYAILIVDDWKFRSRIIKNSLDPHFNQTFRLGLQEIQEEMECRVQIWDWDRFDEDDHMGDAIVKMSRAQLLSPGALDGSYGIIDSEGMDYVKNAKGERSSIHVKFALHKAVQPIC